MTRSLAPPISVRMPPASAGPPAAAARWPQATAQRPAGLSGAVRDAVAPGEPGAGLRGNMTAGAFFRRRGRAPWPGPHPDPAGRAGGLHATGARAGPAAGEYGSAAPCLISLITRPVQGWPVAASPARLAWLFGKPYGSGPPWRVTRRCRPGGISPGGDRSPEGATGPAGDALATITRRVFCLASMGADYVLLSPSVRRCGCASSASRLGGWAAGAGKGRPARAARHPYSPPATYLIARVAAAPFTVCGPCRACGRRRPGYAPGCSLGRHRGEDCYRHPWRNPGATPEGGRNEHGGGPQQRRERDEGTAGAGTVDLHPRTVAGVSGRGPAAEDVQRRCGADRPGRSGSRGAGCLQRATRPKWPRMSWEWGGRSPRWPGERFRRG
jgi:hypothetical protein